MAPAQKRKNAPRIKQPFLQVSLLVVVLCSSTSTERVFFIYNFELCRWIRLWMREFCKKSRYALDDDYPPTHHRHLHDNPGHTADRLTLASGPCSYLSMLRRVASCLTSCFATTTNIQRYHSLQRSTSNKIPSSKYGIQLHSSKILDAKCCSCTRTRI